MATDILAQGAMQFADARLKKNLRRIHRTYPTASHNNQGICRGMGTGILGGKLYELAYERHSLDGNRCMARREQTMKAKSADDLKSLQRVAADIEGTVEGKAYARGCPYQTLAKPSIDIALGGQGTHHDTMNAQGHKLFDRAHHVLRLRLGVNKIACPWTNEHMDANASGKSFLGKSERGRKAIELDVGTKFHTVCSTLPGCPDTFHVGTAYFEHSL